MRESYIVRSLAPCQHRIGSKATGFREQNYELTSQLTIEGDELMVNDKRCGSAADSSDPDTYEPDGGKSAPAVQTIAANVAPLSQPEFDRRSFG
jgi:hypothetical protein